MADKFEKHQFDKQLMFLFDRWTWKMLGRAGNEDWHYPAAINCIWQGGIWEKSTVRRTGYCFSRSSGVHEATGGHLMTYEIN